MHKKKMASRLEALPPELLDLIFQMLEPGLPKNASSEVYTARLQLWCAVSRVSKRLRKASEHYLYRVFWAFGESTHIRPFLRSLCRHPHLIDYVKVLRVHPDDSRARPLTAEDLASFEEAMVPFKDKPFYVNLLESLRYGCNTSETILLFALVTKLQDLFITCYDPLRLGGNEQNYCTGCPNMADIMDSIMRQPEVLRGDSYGQLRSAHLGVQPTEGEGGTESAEESKMHTSLAGGFLQLPSMKDLRLRGFATPSRLDREPNPTTTSHVSALALSGSRMDLSGISHFLTQCRELKKLDLDLPEYETMNVSQLSAVLQLHSKSLERLCLRACGPFAQTFDEQPALQNLATFSKLTFFEVDERLLTASLAWNHLTIQIPELPPSLCKLLLHTNINLEDLPSVLDALMPQIPDSLTHIQVTFPYRIEGNHAFLDFIPENDLSGKIRTRSDHNWTVNVSTRDDGLCISFMCWESDDGTRRVKKTLGPLVEEILPKGMFLWLLQYYQDWPGSEDDSNRAGFEV